MMNQIKHYFKDRHFGFPALVGIAFVFLLAGLLMASSFRLTGNSQALTIAAPAAQGAPASFADLAQDLGPAVVNIKVTKIQSAGFSGGPGVPEGPFGDMFKRYFGDMQRPPAYKAQGAGSGVIIGSDGTILTNNHVVEGAKEIVVTMSDKREYKAKVLGRDPKTDLAVLKVDAPSPLKSATLGDSDALRVGEWVLAIGNPFGLSNTVTSGIVSAKGRVIGAGPYDDFIQTDAPINPGNSGGPLFNMKGEVVGINTAIIPNGQGIGFAIPVNTAKMLVPQLVEKGKVTRGYLGVQIQDVTPELAASLGLGTAKGALVSDVVKDGPAEKGGVKRGDVVVSFNGKEIKDSRALPSVVASTPAGKEVPVRVVRNGKETSLQVKIERLQNEETPGLPAEETSQGKWGLKLKDMNAATAHQLGIKKNHGALVVGVRPGSPAEEASIQRGDVILEVNRTPIKTVEDMKAEIAKSKDKGSLLLLVERNGGTIYLVLKG
ncbi:MAG TPA: DegQ family serine endoprotease [Syntrophorhabdaceae bacterium]|nr:DegQ family serine endoprotease [Syntrophorhabdaceae bacterium]